MLMFDVAYLTDCLCRLASRTTSSRLMFESSYFLSKCGKIWWHCYLHREYLITLMFDVVYLTDCLSLGHSGQLSFDTHSQPVSILCWGSQARGTGWSRLILSMPAPLKYVPREWSNSQFRLQEWSDWQTHYSKQNQSFLPGVQSWKVSLCQYMWRFHRTIFNSYTDAPPYLTPTNPIG